MTALGLCLVVVGAALAVLEAHVVSHGVLGTLALAALVSGVALLLSAAGAATALVVAVALVLAAAGAVAGLLVLRRVLTLRRRPPQLWLTGRVGMLRAVPDPVGRVALDGALWRARAWSPEEAEQLHAGDPVVVESIDGLTLTVRRAEEWEVAP